MLNRIKDHVSGGTYEQKVKVDPTTLDHVVAVLNRIYNDTKAFIVAENTELYKRIEDLTAEVSNLKKDISVESPETVAIRKQLQDRVVFMERMMSKLIDAHTSVVPTQPLEANPPETTEPLDPYDAMKSLTDREILDFVKGRKLKQPNRLP